MELSCNNMSFMRHFSNPPHLSDAAFSQAGVHIQCVVVKLQSLKKPLINQRKYLLIPPLGELAEKSLICVLTRDPVPAKYPPNERYPDELLPYVKNGLLRTKH